MSRSWSVYLVSLLVFLSLPVQAEQPQAPDDTLRHLLKQAINDNSGGFKDRFDAEVWLMDMSNRLAPIVPDPEKRLQLLKQIHYEATRANLRPELVLSLIEVESRFNRFAISNAGAIGLMQVMPFWLKEIGRPKDNLFDVHTNLRLGCTILRYYMDMEKNDLTSALARYNGSLYSYKYTNRIFRVLDKRWRCINC